MSHNSVSIIIPVFNEAQVTGALVYRHPYNIGNGAVIKSGDLEAR